jgi:hypothetical protein
MHASSRGRAGLYWALAAGVVGCLLASSCSVLVDADRSQCSSDADCARRGPEFAGAVCIDSLCASDPTWSCLGRPRPPANSDAGPFDVELTLIDLVTREPLVGVLGALCRKLDVECRVPLGDTIATNDAGQARFAAPAGFDGYVLLQGPKTIPTLLFLGEAVTRSQRLAPTPLPSPSTVVSLTAQVGTPVADGHGIIVVQTKDCQAGLAAGVGVETDNGDGATLPFYWLGGLPTTAGKMTDRSGFAGLVNVPAGAVAVTGTLVGANRKLGTTGLLVRPGFLTFATMVPLGT